MTEIHAVVGRLIDVLETLQIPYLVGGSFASGAWGHPRQTNDIDISLRLVEQDVPRLVSALEGDFALDYGEILSCLAETDEYRSFQLLHESTFFKVDAFVPPSLAYRTSEFERRQRLELFPGLEAFCASAEDVVIQKLRWFELGNRISDRQWNDIVQVLEVQQGKLDEEYLRQWARHFGLEDLLSKALSQAGS